MPRDPFAKIGTTNHTPAPTGGRSSRDPFAAVAADVKAGEAPNGGKPGDSEGGSEADLSELLKGFKSRARTEDDRMALAVDGAFYAVLVFPSTEIRNAFFTNAQCDEANDLNFINGVHLAQRLGIPLPPTPSMSGKGRSAGPWLALGTLPDR
jgi:hypothetical protein